MHPVLQNPQFRLYQAARFAGTIGIQMQSVAVGWQIYAWTHDPLNLGYVGLVQFLPLAGLSLVGGQAADRFERRRILIACYALLALGAAALTYLSATGNRNLVAMYSVLTTVGVARAFAGPASQAFLPQIVPSEQFGRAVAWASSVFQVATVVGPAIGGAIYGWAGGATVVYAATIAFELAAAALLGLMRPTVVARARERVTWRTVVAGIEYVWKHKPVLGVISLDLFAVLFGGAVALLPAVAHDVLHVGPVGLGALRSAMSVGALVGALVLAFRPIERRLGLMMFAGVAAFGVCTIVFGVSRSFVVSFIALALAGAADMLSVFVRQYFVQLSTPDEMRGRVSAVSLVFISASNELGVLESGLTAAWLGTIPAILAGGACTVAVVAVWLLLFPSLRGDTHPPSNQLKSRAS